MASFYLKHIQFIFSLLILSTTFAQDNKVNNTTQLWSEIDALGKINNKWKWQCDLQYSTQSPYESSSLFKYGEQLTIRPWIHYYPKPTIKLSAFVGLWYNYAIAEVGQREYPEYRGALQAQFYKVIAKTKISNRFRTEFRDILDRAGTFEQVFRGRYMFKYQRLLKHTDYDKNSIYSVITEEIFINGGSATTGYKTFDQNRVFLGLGFGLTDNITFETGYFNQFAYHNHDTNFDNNNIWQVTLIFDNITKGKPK